MTTTERRLPRRGADTLCTTHGKSANPQIRSNAYNIYTDRLQINGHSTFTDTEHTRKIGSRPKISLNSIGIVQIVPHKSVKHFLQIETNTDDDCDRKPENGRLQRIFLHASPLAMRDISALSVLHCHTQWWRLLLSWQSIEQSHSSSVPESVP